MKKRLILLAAACALLPAACGGLPAPAAAPDGEPPAAVREPEYRPPEYELVPLTRGRQFRVGETVVALYNYQTVALSVRNPDALSPEDAEKAARNLEAFNGKMEALAEELVEQGTELAADAEYTYREYGGELPVEFEDGADAGGEFHGEVLSLYLHRLCYSGGAHPNRYTDSYLFDLSAGQFIDPTQLAGDPAAFHAGAAALLLEKAGDHPARDGFWEDYAGTISRWNEAAVLFIGEGMLVSYSPYELGPYSTGEVELLISWEELAPLVGEGGMARLGRGAG